MEGGNEVQGTSARKMLLAVAVLLIGLLAVVAYFYLYPTIRKSAGLSDTDKQRILGQLSAGTPVSEQTKLQVLAKLGNQQISSTLTDSDKLKLLESLK